MWTTNADPAPKAAQYLAGQLQAIGLNVSGVKAVDDSVYWDTLLTQKGDPQIAFNHFDQDYPEGEDFIDTLLNGEHIVNVEQRRLQHRQPRNQQDDRPDQAAPLGAARNAAWAKIENTFMEKDAGWAPFLHLQEPEFVSGRCMDSCLQARTSSSSRDVAIAVGANAPDLPISLLRCFSWAKGSHPGGEDRMLSATWRPARARRRGARRAALVAALEAGCRDSRTASRTMGRSRQSCHCSKAGLGDPDSRTPGPTLIRPSASIGPVTIGESRAKVEAVPACRRTPAQP